MDFLKHYGLDLHDFVRGRYPWGKFLRLVDALPTNSHYKDRLLSDPDIAADLLAAERASDEYQIPGTGEAPEPDFTDESPSYQLLRVLTEAVQMLVYLTASNANNNPPEPLPRPRTALDKLKQEQVFETLDDALTALTGEAW